MTYKKERNKKVFNGKNIKIENDIVEVINHSIFADKFTEVGTKKNGELFGIYSIYNNDKKLVFSTFINDDGSEDIDKRYVRIRDHITLYDYYLSFKAFEGYKVDKHIYNHPLMFEIVNACILVFSFSVCVSEDKLKTIKIKDLGKLNCLSMTHILYLLSLDLL